MKKHLLSFTLLGALTACGTPVADIQPQLQPPTPANLQAQSAPANPRLMESFKGYLSHSTYDNPKVAEMLMQVKSLFGSTYDNKNSATRYRLIYSNQKEDLSFISGPVRLGQDGVLYLEHKAFNQGQTSLEYYRLGSFAPLTPQAADGSEIKFQLDQGNALKMKWRGLNPMNHETIQFYVNPKLKPVTLPTTALR